MSTSKTTKPLKKKANLKSIKSLSLSSLVEHLKKIGEVTIVDIVYTNKKTTPDIGSNQGMQFVKIQGDGRDVTLGFNLFSRAVLESGNEDNVFYASDEAEEVFNSAWSSTIKARYDIEEKKYLKKQSAVEATPEAS